MAGCRTPIRPTRARSTVPRSLRRLAPKPAGRDPAAIGIEVWTSMGVGSESGLGKGSGSSGKRPARRHLCPDDDHSSPPPPPARRLHTLGSCRGAEALQERRRRRALTNTLTRPSLARRPPSPHCGEVAPGGAGGSVRGPHKGGNTMTITVTPLHPHIGAEVSGVGVAAAARRRRRRSPRCGSAIDKHSVLVLQAHQSITDAQLKVVRRHRLALLEIGRAACKGSKRRLDIHGDRRHLQSRYRQQGPRS